MSITHDQLRMPQHTYVGRAIRRSHFKLNRAFRVIYEVNLIDVSRNPERVVVMHAHVGPLQAVAVLGKNIWGAWPLIIWEATTAKRNYDRTN